MNNLIKKFITSVFFLICCLVLQSCSTGKIILPHEHSKISKLIKSSLPYQYQNFDKKSYPNKTFIISNMIAIVQPELSTKERLKVSANISAAINKFKIEPQIIVSIIDTESNFMNEKISSTGDLSVAQINVEIWNKEFIRIKKPLMIKQKIKIDQQYAIMKMAEILSIIKKRYSKNDSKWYARYHSNTNKHKSEYLHKLEIRLKMLAMANNLNRVVAGINQSHTKNL